MIVLDAVAAFGTELRVRLLNYWADSPGSQADAARALGVQPSTIAPNAQALVKVGVVVETLTKDPRTRLYSVDVKRLDQLLAALRAYAVPSEDATPKQ